MPSFRRTLSPYCLGAWPRGGAILAVAVALSLLPIDTGYAGWWPWSKDKDTAKTTGKTTPKHVATPKPAAKPKPATGPRHATAPKHAAESKQAAVKCDPSKFRVVVDVGHTVKSDGAMSARNVPEYSFNLRLAKRIVEKLKSDGFPETSLLVTEGKARPSLFKRVAAASRLNANLFLSIHHDSVPDKLLEKWDFEDKKSYFSDRFSGYSVFVSQRNPQFDNSLAFAKLVGGEMKSRGLKYAIQYTLPIMGRYQRKLLDKDVGVYRYDELVVLSRTSMPAVLLEAGSIINRDEELAMNSPERHDLTSMAVAGALKAYCDSH